MPMPPMPARARSDALLARLGALGLAVRTHEHAAVFTVDEARALRAALPGRHTKNLFLKDKKDRLWLAVADADAAVDLKALRGQLGAATLSFGRPELLRDVLGVAPGSVTPFALINDTNRRVRLALDGALLADGDALLYFHPLVNTRSSAIRAADFQAFLASIAVEPLIVAL